MMPNMLINKTTGHIKSWGYCEFEEKEGFVVVESPTDTLPEKEMISEEYFYINGKIVVKKVEVPIVISIDEKLELLTQRVIKLEKNLDKIKY